MARGGTAGQHTSLALCRGHPSQHDWGGESIYCPCRPQIGTTEATSTTVVARVLLSFFSSFLFLLVFLLGFFSALFCLFAASGKNPASGMVG